MCSPTTLLILHVLPHYTSHTLELVCQVLSLHFGVLSGTTEASFYTFYPVQNRILIVDQEWHITSFHSKACDLSLLNLYSRVLVPQYWGSALNLVYLNCFVLIDQMCCHYWPCTLKHESYLCGANAFRGSFPALLSWHCRLHVMLFRRHSRSSKLQDVLVIYGWCATPMVLTPPMECIVYGTCVPMYIVTVLEFAFFRTCPAITELTV